MIWAAGAAIVLMFTVAVNMAVLVKMNREHAAERSRLVNHILSGPAHEYVALQRADAQQGKEPRPNRPEKIHPEGL